MYLRNAIMETKDSSEKTNTGQSLRETVWKKNGCYWFTFWRDLNMVEKKGWFRSKRLRQSLWQGSGYTYLGNVRSTGIDSVSFLWKESKPGKVGKGPVTVLSSMGSAVHMPLLHANSGSRASMNKGKPMSDLTGWGWAVCGRKRMGVTCWPWT